MSEVWDKGPLDGEAKAVLLGESSMLRPVYQLMPVQEWEEWQAVSGLETAFTSIMKRLPAFTGRLNRGPAKSTPVHDRLFSSAEGYFSVPRVRFRSCGNALLCKTTHALPLALSGTNEYHQIVLIGHVPALAFRAQWFQTARWTCLRKTDSEN